MSFCCLSHVKNVFADTWVKCLAREEVASAIHMAHDEAGHFGGDVTRRRLAGQVYWPNMSKDVVRYILGCWKCAKHAPNRPKIPSQPITVTEPFQAIGIDHVGPFPEIESGSRYLLVLGGLLLKVLLGVPCVSTEAGRALLSWLAAISTRLYTMYTDSGSAFTSAEFKSTASLHGVEVVTAPSKSHRSVGRIDVCNRILQAVLNKAVHNPTLWDESMVGVQRSMNGRRIKSLGYSPAEILLGVL